MTIRHFTGHLSEQIRSPASRRIGKAERSVAEVIGVQAQWDAEAAVWWAESADRPGLVSEAPTLDALIERVSLVIPDLLAVAEDPLTTNSPPRRVTFRIDRMVEVAA